MRTLMAPARPQQSALTARAPRKSKYRFALEITGVVLIKAGLLWLAWHTWFSHPLAQHMQMPPALVQQQILGAPQDASAAVFITSGATHDPRR